MTTFKPGVTNMRKKWEESNRLFGSSTLPRGFKSANSPPKFKQPGYQDLDRLLGGFRGGKSSRISTKTWNNVVTSPNSPRNNEEKMNGSVDSGRSDGSERRENFESGRTGSLPTWARNGVIDDDLNYDDVVVV